MRRAFTLQMYEAAAECGNCGNCGTCGKPDAIEDELCPFAHDIRGDDSPCEHDCCAECRSTCADEI